MKKQFFRVKQLADQAIARAEKSEVLTEDLAASERRVENLRVSCSVIRKRLTESLSGHGADDDAKRLRKMQEHQLGAAMKEGAAHVGTDTILGAIMSECGEAQTRLAGERLEYERALEQTVLESSVLQQLLDTDIPSVTKLRKTLARLTLDMDASRSRYQNAQRHSAGAVGGAGPQQKVEAIRDELEAAQIKVEQHRDTLAGDMFQLLSREPELAQLLLHLVKLQTEYYRSSMQLLESTIPGLQASLNAASVKPVFGLSLEEHLRVSGRQVALPLEMCVCRLLQIGADEEGLFRVAGSTSKARKLKSCFDAGLVTAEHMAEYMDAHVVADALKAYLRDLPEPLMTTDFYDEWMSAARVQDEGQRLQALWQVLHQLPDVHYANLRYLIKFLALLSKNNKVNKMTTQNIAIVMAPNLLWTRIEEGFNMTATGTHSLVVDSLIQHCDWFFPEEVDFFITYPRELPSEAPPAATTAAPDSPVLSNGSAPLSRPTPGHQRSKSTDSGVVSAAASVAMAAVGVESAAGESASGSSASLTSSDPSMHHCESPKPTMRRKKQAAPPPPTHRQTIAASAPAHAPAPTRPTAEAPPPPVPTPEADVESRPEHPVKPEVPASKPEIPVSKPEIPVSKPEFPVSKPEVPAARPESDGAPSSTVTAAAAAAAASAAGRAGADAESGRALADLVQKSAAIAAGAASAAAAVSRAEATRAAPAPSTPAPAPGPAAAPVPSAASVTHTTHVGHADPAAAGGAPPVPAPRGGPTAATPPSSAAVSATPGKTPRPDRPPPPAKLVERAASFSPSDTSGAQRQKPALPERPGTLRRTPRNSAELTSSKDSAGSTDAQTPPVVDSQSGVAPPPIGWAVPAVPAPTAGTSDPRARPRPSGHPPSAPPPVPAPRAAAAGDTTTHL